MLLNGVTGERCGDSFGHNGKEPLALKGCPYQLHVVRGCWPGAMVVSESHYAAVNKYLANIHVHLRRHTHIKFAALFRTGKGWNEFKDSGHMLLFERLFTDYTRKQCRVCCVWDTQRTPHCLVPLYSHWLRESTWQGPRPGSHTIRNGMFLVAALLHWQTPLTVSCWNDSHGTRTSFLYSISHLSMRCFMRCFDIIAAPFKVTTRVGGLPFDPTRLRTVFLAVNRTFKLRAKSSQTGNSFWSAWMNGICNSTPSTKRTTSCERWPIWQTRPELSMHRSSSSIQTHKGICDKIPPCFTPFCVWNGSKISPFQDAYNRWRIHISSKSLVVVGWSFRCPRRLNSLLQWILSNAFDA